MIPERRGESRQTYVFGPFTLDTDLRELYEHHVGGRRHLHLRPQTLVVLLFLIQERKRDVSKEEIWKAMQPWGTTAPDSFVYDVNHVDQTLKEIRSALQDSIDSPRYILRKAPGFVRFIGEVSPIASDRGTPKQPLLASETVSVILGTLCPSFEIVPSSGMCDASVTADHFYDGFPPTWSELKAHFDIERALYSAGYELRSTLADLLRKKGVGMLALTGVAGSGKTTVLHRLGFDAANSGITVLKLKYDWYGAIAPSLATQLKAVAASNDGPLIVILDNVGDLVFEHPILDSMIRELQHSCRDNSIVIICSDETNRWYASRRRVPSLSDVQEFTVLHLMQSECELLVDTILRLEASQKLSVITHLSRQQRLQLCEKPAERQFLVAMLQMRHGAQFRTIIRTEFQRIPMPEAQRAYSLICQLNALNFSPPKRALLAAVGVESALQLAHFGDSTKGLLVPEGSCYRARHIVIAKEVAGHVYATPETRGLAIVEILRALNPRDDSERQWLVDFFTKPNIYRLLCSLFNRDGEVVQRFYADSRAVVNDHRWPPQHLTYVASAEGMSHRILRNFDRARRCFIEASEADPSYEWPVRQHAWLEHDQGQFGNAGTLAQRAVDLAPDRIDTIAQCARILSTTTVGNFKRARQYYQRAREIDPANQQVERDWRYYCAAEKDLQGRRQVLSDNQFIPDEVQDRVRPGLSFFRVLFGTKDQRFRNRLKLHLGVMERQVDGALEDLFELTVGVDLDNNRSLNALYKLNVGRLMYLEWYHKSVQHQPEAMEQAFQSSLVLNPSDPFAHCWNGTFLKEVRKDLEGARKEYETAVRLGRESRNPKLKDHPLFLNNMALLLIEEVQTGLKLPQALGEARELLIKAVDRVPEVATEFHWPRESLEECEALMRELGMRSD